MEHPRKENAGSERERERGRKPEEVKWAMRAKRCVIELKPRNRVW